MNGNVLFLFSLALVSDNLIVVMVSKIRVISATVSVTLRSIIIPEVKVNLKFSMCFK